MIETIQQILQLFFINLEPEQQSKIINTLLVILVLTIVRFVALRLIHTRLQANTRALYNWRKGMEYGVAFIGLVLIGRIWLEGVQSLMTYLGILSAGLAIALQDLLIDLAGFLFIVWRRPFVVGDRIQIEEISGDVIDIRFFQFSLLEIGGGRIDAEQSTGRIVHVPNGKVFTEPLINAHQGLPYIWNEIPVQVTFESDWRKAKVILIDVINRLAPDVAEDVRRYEQKADQRFVIGYTKVTPTVYTKVSAHGVLFSMRYMVDPRRKRATEQAIWEEVLTQFEKHPDLEFAYETQREYIRFYEQKRPSPDPHEAPTVVSKPVPRNRKYGQAEE